MRKLIFAVLLLVAATAFAQLEPECGTFCEDGSSGSGTACYTCFHRMDNNQVECLDLRQDPVNWEFFNGNTQCTAHNAVIGPNGCTFSGSTCGKYRIASMFRERMLRGVLVARGNLEYAKKTAAAQCYPAIW